LANSAAKSAASLDGGSDPVDRARIATSWSPSATCSLNFAPLRLPQGGDQPNQTTIDNNIASHGIALTAPFGITKPAVRFPPNRPFFFSRSSDTAESTLGAGQPAACATPVQLPSGPKLSRTATLPTLIPQCRRNG
jgi:hypothetical protein